MGKHRKKQNASNASGIQKMSPQMKNYMNSLVQKLLNKCTSLQATTRKMEWDEYQEIYCMIQEVREIEKDYVVPLPKRDEHWKSFYTWCTQNDAEFSAVEVKKIGEENHGIIAKKVLNEGDIFLKVPRKIMLTTVSAQQSKLGPLIDKDPILQHMPNVVLALHLLMEYLDPSSFWQPYISILPAHYSTVLYYSIEELHELDGSPAQEDAVKICRSIARQYSYFHQLFQFDSYGRTLAIRDYFTYDLYRWAVSTVMTRQNSIPAPDGKLQITALIPLWDMCNHCNGKFSTDFNMEKDSVEAFSMKTYQEDEELPRGKNLFQRAIYDDDYSTLPQMLIRTNNMVHIFYGSRTNAEFFVHNGFVYPNNEHDAMGLKFGLSKSDPLFGLKSTLCSKLGLPLTGVFQLHKEKSVIDNEMLLYLRVSVMKEEELKQELENDATTVGTASESNDLKERTLKFLQTRLSLLLKCYKTTIEDDEKLLLSPTNLHCLMAVQLRLAEKKLLMEALKYCNENSNM